MMKSSRLNVYLIFSSKDHPEFVEHAGKKDSKLDDRLKQVFVTSSDYVSSLAIMAWPNFM